MDCNGVTHDWIEGVRGAVTVCDADGIIVAMNAASRELFAKNGGAALIGTSLFQCHPEPSRTMLREIMERRATHAYTIERDGRHTLILQIPWFRDGEYAGHVEIGTPIEGPLPHFKRG
jgi:transcriptional regulator with PAS, ATPase and Fis domain